MTKFEAATLLEGVVREIEEFSIQGNEIDYALENLESTRDDLEEAIDVLKNKNYDNGRF